MKQVGWNGTQTQANRLYDLLFAFHGFVWLSHCAAITRTHSRRVNVCVCMLLLEPPESEDVRVNEARALEW